MATEKMKYLLLLLFSLMGCGDQGIQGTSYYSSFQGLQTVEALSPTAVKLSWNLDSAYSEYKIYENDSVSPLRTETFSNTQISGLSPSTDYSYMVSGYSVSGGEKFIGGKYTVRTLDRFTGLPSGGVVVISGTEIKLSWSLNSAKAKYRVYQKEQGAAWNFNTAVGTVSGSNEYQVSQLTSGKTYCFFVVAEYLDGTLEPDTTNTSQVDATAPCQLLTTTITGLPSVSVNSVVPGGFPWFWTSNGNPTYKTEIYDLDTNTRIASRTGNGTFRAFQSSAEGKRNYYALVTSGTSVARVTVSISGGSSPTAVKLRSLNSSGPHGPLFPPLLANGRGQQNLGNVITTGDFNCDGFPDVAVAAETATPFATDHHYSSIGAVIIYYSWQPPSYVDGQGNVVTPSVELKTSIPPSATAVFPNPLLITYPVTADDVKLGHRLSVGNFNGDCYYRDPTSPSKGNCNAYFNSMSSPTAIANVKSCDDLAISTLAGYFYLAYGDPVEGLVSGSQSNTAGIDELTCDPASNTCRTAKYTVPATYSASGFASAMTSGDFNNDGYDDLAVTAKSSTNQTDILVYRGTAQGLTPYGTTKSHAKIDPTALPLGNTMGTTIAASDNFGFSLGTAYNSRLCVNNSPAGYIFRTPEPPRRKGYDLTKCDDLVIGAPDRSSSRGSIFTCKGNLNYPSADIPKIASWSCQEQFPDTSALTSPTITIRKYGYSIVGVPNQNGYPLSTNVAASVPANALPDIGGAVFVGAPTSSIGTSSSAGAVFGYYITPKATDFSLGGIQGILGTSASGHSVNAQNAVACDNLNANVTNGGLRQCENQIIYPSPSSASAQFGYALATIPDRVQDLDPWMPMLAVSAPYRSATDASGNVLSSVGAIYLYRGDISTFGAEGVTQITAPKYYVDNALNSSCISNCTWYSGGISPFGPTVVYPTTLLANSNFGIGGSAGGSFNGDNFADILSSAPGQSLPSSANGGVYGFFSSQGSFSPAENTPDLTISQNISLEGNYRFEEAKIIGDVNGDGYQDVATHINNNGTWILALYYGSANGLIQTPDPSFVASGNQPLLIKSLQDSGLGVYFYSAGDVNGDGFDDILAMGANASYIYYGSASGLIANVEPDIAPVGKNPLKFAMSGAESISFHKAADQEGFTGSLAISNEYRHTVQAVTHGHFNDDIYSDIAIRVYSNSINPPASLLPSGLNFSTASKGRVVILYGGSQGPETDRVSGRIRYANSGNPADVVVENPCDSTQTPKCKVQVLASVNAGVGFGFAVAKRRGLNSSTSDPYDGLVISDPSYNSSTGEAYVYQGNLRGLVATPIQTLVPRDASSLFGYSMVEAGDINKDGYLDLAINSGGGTAPGVTVFYGAKVSGQNAYFGAASLVSTTYWGAPAIVTNAQHASAASPRPQVILPSTFNTGDLVGRGLAAVGDFNQDGYADIAVNIPNGEYNISGIIPEAGYVLIYFGGDLGIQSYGTVASPYPKCYAGTTPVCEPFQIYLPNVTTYEFSAANLDSVGDINGDGLPDLLIGGFGRNHPSGKAISSGVIYVLY
jgi:hypothetical protein